MKRSSGLVRLYARTSVYMTVYKQHKFNRNYYNYGLYKNINYFIHKESIAR